MTALRSFAGADRFLAEIATPQIRPGYVLVGDETFLYQRCRSGVLRELVPETDREFGLHDLDLTQVSVVEALDQARTPSLMCPFQVIWIRGLKTLYGRGQKKDEFAAIEAYFRHPNPAALVIFVADHLSLPADLRRIEMQDKDRYERIRETLGDWCSIVELSHVDQADAIRWLAEQATIRGIRIEESAARELVDALGADMMLVAAEFEKLCLYVQGKQILTFDGKLSMTLPAINLGAVETMVLAAKQRSLYELTDAISAKDRPRALARLHGLLNASDGGEDSAIGHLYMLARTFRQMLILAEKNVHDQRAIWAVLWQGFRMPPFAAEDLIRQARRYRDRSDLTRALRLIARADLDIRSSPPDKRIVLERLVLALSSDRATQPNQIFE